MSRNWFGDIVHQLKQTAKDSILIQQPAYFWRYPLPLAEANGQKVRKKIIRALIFFEWLSFLSDEKV